MKNFKFLYLLLAVVGVVTFTSCKEEWAPGAQDTNMGVYFAEPNDIVVAAEDTSVEILVKRNQTAEASQVSVLSEDKSKLFTVPSTVAFAAGAEEAVLKITFDGKALTPGTTYPVSIQLAQAQASTYGISEYVFNITLPEPWLPMGTGLYVDDFLNVLPEVEAGYSSPVDFEKHAENPNRIRVVNPFAPEVIGTMWGGIPGYMIWEEDAPNHYLEFDITNPANVGIADLIQLPFKINFQNGACQAYMGFNTNEDGSLVSPVVYEDGIIKFPTDGSMLLLYEEGGKFYGWPSNSAGLMQYVLPGVELSDYTLIAEYAGMYVSADNATSSAIIGFTLGADVESYKFTIVSGFVEDVAAVAATIVDGTAEDIVEGTPELTQYEAQLPTGTYTVVAVAYAGGEVVGQPASTFFYFPGADGGEKPQVEANFVVTSLAQIFAADADRAAAMEKSYPAEYFAGILLDIKKPYEVTGLRLYYDDAAALHNAVETGVFESYDEIVEAYGDDVYVWVQEIKEGNIRILNFPAGSNYCYLFAVDTIYGTTQYYHVDYAMPAYSGNFPVGKYTMTDDKYTATVSITPGTSPANVLVETSDIPGWQFYGAYNEAAQTVTIDGTAYGFEGTGSLFGYSLGIDNSAYVCPMAYADAELKTAAESVVISLTDNVPTGLSPYFAIFTVADNTVTGTAAVYSPATTITPAAAAAACNVASKEFKSKSVKSEIAMIEVAHKPIVVKAFNGNFDYEFNLTEKAAQIF